MANVFMDIDPQQQSGRNLYSIMIRAITPRPIAWVSTCSGDGIPNLAPFSYFSGVGTNPPALMVSIATRPDGSKKDTLRNIESTGEFVVNVVPFRLRNEMVQTAEEFPFEISEFEKAGLTSTVSKLVAPPGVGESPIQLECRMLDIVRVGRGPSSGNCVFGQIVWIRLADDVLNEEKKIDPGKVDSIGRLGGLSYCRTRERFELK